MEPQRKTDYTLMMIIIQTDKKIHRCSHKIGIPVSDNVLWKNYFGFFVHK